MACAAALMGLCSYDCLPRPLLGLRGEEQAHVAEVLRGLELLCSLREGESRAVHAIAPPARFEQVPSIVKDPPQRRWGSA